MNRAWLVGIPGPPAPPPPEKKPLKSSSLPFFPSFFFFFLSPPSFASGDDSAEGSSLGVEEAEVDSDEGGTPKKPPRMVFGSSDGRAVESLDSVDEDELGDVEEDDDDSIGSDGVGGLLSADGSFLSAELSLSEGGAGEANDRRPRRKDDEEGEAEVAADGGDGRRRAVAEDDASLESACEGGGLRGSRDGRRCMTIKARVEGGRERE